MATETTTTDDETILEPAPEDTVDTDEFRVLTRRELTPTPGAPPIVATAWQARERPDDLPDGFGEFRLELEYPAFMGGHTLVRVVVRPTEILPLFTGYLDKQFGDGFEIQPVTIEEWDEAEK